MPITSLPENVRLARLSDLPRISIVSTAGFYHSPVFHYLRPSYKRYLQDTLASYWAECQESILDPDAVVVVAEQASKENESDSVFPELKQVYPPLHEQVPQHILKTNKVIVGVAILSLKADPKRSGNFMPDGTRTDITCHDTQDLGRDKCLKGIKRFCETENKAKEEWFGGHMEITSIVVHPAYWRNGNGKHMAEWFMALADEHNLPMCISAAPMGAMLATHLGFKEAAVVEITGYEEYPGDMRLWFGIRRGSGADSLEKRQARGRCKGTPAQRPTVFFGRIAGFGSENSVLLAWSLHRRFINGVGQHWIALLLGGAVCGLCMMM